MHPLIYVPRRSLVVPDRAPHRLGCGCGMGVGGSPPPWTPAAVPGCTTFVTGDTTAYPSAVVLPGDTPANASQWTDFSGVAHHLVQTTGAKRPLWVASGTGGVLETDGVDDWMACSVPGEAQPVHIFMLAKWIANIGSIIDGGSLAADECSAYGTNASCRMYSSTHGAAMTIPSVDYHVFEMLFASPNSAFAFNGAALSAPFDCGSVAPQGMLIGCYGSHGGGFVKARYASICKYNRALTTAERGQVVSYLTALKTRLAL